MSHGLEVMLLGWSNTSQGGPRITLQLADEADLEWFKHLTMQKGRGKTAIAGQRLMAGFEEIDDQEQPKKDEVGPLCRLAARWCQDPLFQAWIELQLPHTWGAALRSGTSIEELTARIVREWCSVSSRRELDTTPEAAALFQSKVRLPYMAYLHDMGERNHATVTDVQERLNEAFETQMTYMETRVLAQDLGFKVGDGCVYTPITVGFEGKV